MTFQAGRGGMDHAFGHDVGDWWKRVLCKLWHRPPRAFVGFVLEIIEGQRAGARGLADDDPADHACDLVRQAEVVKDALHRKRDFKGMAGEEILGIPGLRDFGDTQRMVHVLRVIGGRRVDAGYAPPTHAPSRLDQNADGVEMDLAPGRIAHYADLDGLRSSGTNPRAQQSGAGEKTS